MLTKPPQCENCPLWLKGTGYAPTSGPPGARVLLLGEALGLHEARSGQPFVGPAGGVLTRAMDAAGIERASVRIGNVVRCQPPNDWLVGAPWEWGAQEHCWHAYGQQEIDQLADGSIVVPLGATAARRVLGMTKKVFGGLNNWHATVSQISQPDGRRLWVVPSFHPAFLLRGGMKYFDPLVFAFGRVKEILATGTWDNDAPTLVIDPSPEWFAGWVDLQLASPDPYWLAIDTETPDKDRAQDEGELGAEATSWNITHLNFATSWDEGVTIPNLPAYRKSVRRLLADPRSTKLLFHADYDHPRLIANDTPLAGDVWDVMWMWHVLQSDQPRGLGYVSAFCSRYGAWKHLYGADWGTYRALDGVQTYRDAVVIARALAEQGMLDVFRRHVGLVDHWATKPAEQVGLKVDRAALEQFVADLTTALRERLDLIHQLAQRHTLWPKDGMSTRPDGKVVPFLKPKVKGGKQSAKQQWTEEHLTVVERRVPRQIQVCLTCGKQEVTKSHACPAFPWSAFTPEQQASYEAAGWVIGKKVKKVKPVAQVVTETHEVTRWFYQRPFNPSTPAEILAYIREQGHTPGKHKKTRRDTSDRKTLETLFKQTGDPVYQAILDHRAIEKVRSTYGVGTLQRLDANSRVHSTFGWKPSTLRGNSTDPNLHNVITDRGGKVSLAAGFRAVIVAEGACEVDETDPQVSAWLAKYSGGDHEHRTDPTR